jgi:ribonuclease-3
MHNNIISGSEFNHILLYGDRQNTVKNVRLYNQAFTPRWVNRQECYERLEFLGDSVLNVSISSYLYKRYPSESEGFMTRMRSKLVSGDMLSDLAKKHTPFGTFVYRIASNSVVLKKHKWQGANYSMPDEPLEMACNSKKVLEDVFEAFLGALFLDLGHDVASEWLINFFEMYVDFANIVVSKNNSKDLLNISCMKHHGYVPIFELADASIKQKRTSGVNVNVRDINGVLLSTGRGANRKEAELDAANRALRQLPNWDPEGVQSININNKPM